MDISYNYLYTNNFLPKTDSLHKNKLTVAFYNQS